MGQLCKVYKEYIDKHRLQISEKEAVIGKISCSSDIWNSYKGKKQTRKNKCVILYKVNEKEVKGPPF